MKQLYLGEYKVPLGKVALAHVTDFTSEKFTQVSFRDEVTEDNTKCPK